MVKAVLDTNVFVSAIIFPVGAPDLVFKAAIRKQYEMIICPFILSELRKVLKEKFYYTEEEALRVTEFIRSISSCIVKLGSMSYFNHCQTVR